MNVKLYKHINKSIYLKLGFKSWNLTQSTQRQPVNKGLVNSIEYTRYWVGLYNSKPLYKRYKSKPLYKLSLYEDRVINLSTYTRGGPPKGATISRLN